MTSPPARPPITAVVLAGGRGSRMGGIDKGLRRFAGTALSLHAARRVQPQVDTVLISASRHLDTYRAFGFPVLTDQDPAAFAGPLAGMAAALAQCRTPWLLTLPCDAPFFPLDLAERLLQAAIEHAADVAVACGDERPAPRWQSAFCLLDRRLAAELTAALERRERKVESFIRAHRHVAVPFEDSAHAFANLNTDEEFAQAEAIWHRERPHEA